MTGLALILRQLGVKIDPVEIEQQFQQIKTLVPQFASNIQTAFNKLHAEIEEVKVTNRRLEQKLDTLIAVIQVSKKAA